MPIRSDWPGRYLVAGIHVVVGVRAAATQAPRLLSGRRLCERGLGVELRP
jgi:hypothetical protein